MADPNPYAAPTVDTDVERPSSPRLRLYHISAFVLFGAVFVYLGTALAFWTADLLADFNQITRVGNAKTYMAGVLGFASAGVGMIGVARKRLLISVGASVTLMVAIVFLLRLA